MYKPHLIITLNNNKYYDMLCYPFKGVGRVASRLSRSLVTPKTRFDSQYGLNVSSPFLVHWRDIWKYC